MKSKRAISMLLIIFLVFSTIPSNVYALENNNLTTSTQTDQSNITSNTKKIGKIIRELTDERTQNTKRFQKDDGTFEVVQYAKPIHYLDNGKWKDIDNTLENVAEKDANGNSVDYLQNKQNDFKIKISKNSTDEKLINLQKDKYNISWNLSNAELTQGAAAALDDSKLNDAISRSANDKINKDKQLLKAASAEKQKAKNILVQNANTETLKKVASTVNFPNIYSNVDLQYILNGSDVKENILLNKVTDKTSFDFNLNVTNVIPVLQKDKSIIFYDSSNKSKQVFKMQAPFMYDKAGNESTNIDISLKSVENGYVLSLTPDKDWINSSDRVFPVTIDPSLETSLDVNSIHDTFVSSNDSSNKWINQYLRTGQTPSIGTTRTYMKFDLPSLTSSDMVVDAELYLFYWSPESSLTTHKINAHNVTQNFDPSNINWSSQPSCDTNITDYYTVSDPYQNYWAYWNITSIAKQWYTTGNNYGVMLEENSGGGNSVFWSSDVGGTYQALRPQIVFTYVNNTGLEDYWTYHSQDAGRAGTGYINDYNGGLTFIHNDL